MTTTVTLLDQDSQVEALTCEMSSDDVTLNEILLRISLLPHDDPRRYECQALLFEALARQASVKASLLRDQPLVAVAV